MGNRGLWFSLDGSEGDQRLSVSNVNPYCTAQNVVDQLPSILRGAGQQRANITIEKLSSECISISSEMDTRFHAVGISVPVDTSNTERVRRNLERIAINGVAASVLKSAHKPGDRNYELAELYEAQYYRDIIFIELNGLGLDEEEDKGISAPRFGKSDYPSAFTPQVPNSLNPVDWGRW